MLRHESRTRGPTGYMVRLRPLLYIMCEGKGKAIPLQAWTDP